MKKDEQKKGRFQKREEKEFDEEVLQIDRVTKVVKGGRRLRFRATVVIGDRKNRVGLGTGKSNEVTGAIQKAIAKAKKNLVHVVLDGSTIPHDVKVKYKSSKLMLMPAVPGTGIIAGGAVRKVLELSGVKDILGKSLGSNNKLNSSRAALDALRQLRTTPAMARRAKANLINQKNKPTEKPAEKKEEAQTKKPATKKAEPKDSAPVEKPTTK